MNTEEYKRMKEEERPLAEPRALENVKMIVSVALLCFILVLGYLTAIGLQKGYERWAGKHESRYVYTWEHLYKGEDGS